jgi:hypothetical protein
MRQVEAFLKSDLVQPARSLRTRVRRFILNGAPFLSKPRRLGCLTKLSADP